MSKKRIKIMIQGPNRRTYFRKGPVALHVSDNQELEKFGTLDVEPIDVDELKKLSNEEIETMWKETSRLQRKENIKN